MSIRPSTPESCFGGATALAIRTGFRSRLDIVLAIAGANQLRLEDGNLETLGKVFPLTWNTVSYPMLVDGTIIRCIECTFDCYLLYRYSCVIFNTIFVC